MKFTSIPEAYNSFREPLVYSFDTQTTTPTDVVIEVKNYHDDSIIGRKKLYSVTSGEVDIAPICAGHRNHICPKKSSSAAWWIAGHR